MFIRCREEDKDLIEEVTDEAVSTYKEMLIKEVVKFHGKSEDDIPCKIIIDGKHLETTEQNSVSGTIGGFKLYAKRGRIVCSQTIDDRIDLVF